MSKNPAAILIVRHGSRLDQVDKNWVSTSPTPYNPPLTYGGWAQCQALGLRIGSILAAREEAGEKVVANERPTSRRQKVVIHSSPFVRCIQSSIAISAGLGQFQHETKGKSTKPSPLGRLPLTAEETEQPAEIEQPGRKLPSEPPPRSSGNLQEGKHSEHGYLPTKLRMDAFLGEWLSPDYFRNITPPPSSSLMLASAKAELMRPAEEIRGADLSPVPSGRLSTGWLTDWSDINAGQPVPHRTRAATFDIDRKRQPKFNRISLASEGLHYAPPIPTYAISSAEPIPIGFVAHARDACVDIDHDWDSMKALQWGDGGELGEEWSRMHRRFRNGLQQMLSYYKNEEGDHDLVLILVTHGAGCNALIGAITSAPVLLDFGVASLTMAVRKEETTPTTSTKRQNSVDLGVADHWDMNIIASTEHLRGATNPLGLNSPRLGTSPAFASRRMVGPDSFDGFSLGDPFVGRPSSSNRLGRSASQHAAPSDYLNSSTGLWRTRTTQDETDEVIAQDESKHNQSTGPTETSQVPVRTASQGLWGSDVQMAPKRRWTLVDSP